MELDMSKMYTRLVKSLNQTKGLYEVQRLNELSLDDKEDWYSSIYYYNEDHKKRFDSTGSVAGVKDVVTDRLVFDLDSEQDLEIARQDALTLLNRMKDRGINPESTEIYFSGMKGFTLILNLKDLITPEQALNAAQTLAGDLASFDTKIYDPQRILRIPGTKHQKSGLYKVPLTLSQLQELSTDSIRARATKLENVVEDFSWDYVEVDPNLFAKPKPKNEVKPMSDVTGWELMEETLPARGWRKCKWALVQGKFGETQGERHHALMIIASTCRSLGYDKDTTYYICKSALKKQAARTGRDEFSKEELWQNIIEQTVFADTWEGGSYSCAKDPWLKEYCKSIHGKNCTEEKEDKEVLALGDMAGDFSSYAKNFESNLVRTGIKELDDNVTFSTSTLVGLLGAPGSGKTTMALNYLKNTSQNNIQSMFFSLDMGMPLVYSKLLQKETGHTFKSTLRMFKDEPERAEKLNDSIKDIYKNVGFCFKGGLTVADMKRMVQERNDETGKHTRLIVVDYLECIAGPYADPIASGGFIANQLKDMANELQCCVLLLLQTQKHSTPDISDPLLSLRGVKGSSIIEQSCSSILTLWREGYSPKYQDEDRYISFAVVKNRFGPLWTGDFSWDGLRGDIKSLSDEQRGELSAFKERKKQDKYNENADNNGGWD